MMTWDRKQRQVTTTSRRLWIFTKLMRSSPSSCSIKLSRTKRSRNGSLSLSFQKRKPRRSKKTMKRLRRSSKIRKWLMRCFWTSWRSSRRQTPALLTKWKSWKHRSRTWWGRIRRSRARSKSWKTVLSRLERAQAYQETASGLTEMSTVPCKKWRTTWTTHDRSWLASFRNYHTRKYSYWYYCNM